MEPLKFNHNEFDRQTKRLEETVAEQTRYGIMLLHEMFTKAGRDIPNFSISNDGEGGIDVQFRTGEKNLLVNLSHSYGDYPSLSYAGVHVGLDYMKKQDEGIQGYAKIDGLGPLLDWLEKEDG